MGEIVYKPWTGKGKGKLAVTIDGLIREIHYENVYTDVIFMGPVPDNCATAAMVALQSQPGVWYWDRTAFGKRLSAASQQPEGTLRFQNIEVQWSATAEDAVYTSGSFLRDNQNQTFDVSITWTIRIDDQ